MATPEDKNVLDRYLGCLLGLACGDAVGTTVEFKARGSFPPVTDMTGGGPFGLQPGEWTDDTSMALCLAASLIERRGFDARDQMERYVNWWRHGYMSSTGRCFDIGMTVRAALNRFVTTGDPMAGSTDPQTAGNGSLMRLAPVVMAYAPDEAAVRRFARLSSTTTHAAPQAVDACEWFAILLNRALSGAFFSKDVLLALARDVVLCEPIAQIANGGYMSKVARRIRGSGYCTESLEAALWCFHQTDSFEGAVLAATNLGDDADTTAAITGQIAGAFYGLEGIPLRWRERIKLAGDIESMARELHDQTFAS